jgi:hypothetical protein
VLYDDSTVDSFKVCRLESKIRILNLSTSFVIGGMCVVSLVLAVLMMTRLRIQP